MENNQDIRATALSDQLREIDQRYEGPVGWSSSWKTRAWQAVSSLILLAVVAQWVDDWIGPGLVLVLIFFSLDPLLRFYWRRKAEKERTRVIRLYEEIDARAALTAEKEADRDP